MVIAVFSRPLSRILVPPDPPDFSSEEAILDSLMATFQGSSEFSGENAAVAEPFVFDPNKASAEDLESLGIPRPLANRIVNYRDKGGYFRKKSDLLRIYGLDTTIYSRLYAFIDLPVAAPSRQRLPAKVAEKPAAKRVNNVARFDLNEADTAALTQIRGIGPVLAQRIVRYRSILGGFVARAQLLEVYRLDSAAVDALFQAAYIGENFVPRPIPLNTSSEYELAGHPYIGKTLAKAIVAYRFQHGSFENIEDVRQIHHVDDSVFHRIRPYVSVD